MKSLDTVRTGLFFLMLSMAVNILAAGTVFYAGIQVFSSPDMESLLRLVNLAVMMSFVATIVGFLGKVLCVKFPEKTAKAYITAAIVFDLISIILQVLNETGLLESVILGWTGSLCSLVALILFLSFLSRLGQQTEQPRVEEYIRWIYRLFFGSFGLGFGVFFLDSLALVFALALIGAIGLYTLALFTLFQGMPAFMAAVARGEVNPAESFEDRKHRERLEKAKAAKEGFKKKAPASSTEEPQGPQPGGSELYKLPKKMPPLHLAVKEGDPIKVETLLGAGADPGEAIKGGVTPLHIAASGGVMEVADLLIGAGVPVDKTADFGLTPLYFAIQTANTNLLGFLLARGASLHHQNAEGYTPLHWACSVAHPMLVAPTRVKIAETLLQKGAAPQATNSQGQTARQLASLHQLEELGRALDRFMGLAPAPKEVAQDSQDEVQITVTSIEPATASDLGSPSKTFEGSELLEIPKDLNPLFQAAKEGDPDKVELFLDQGEDLNQALADGRTCMHITAVTGVMGVANLLLRRGSKVDVTTNSGVTPIFLAVLINNMNMAGFLLSRKANVNHQDGLGRTPLHWACAGSHSQLDDYSRKKMIDFLLQQGADHTITDQNGFTPDRLALEFNLPDAADHMLGRVHDRANTQPDEDEE